MRIVLFNFIAYFLVIFINFLANVIPLNGQTTGDISNRLNVLFTPSGYVFSIWGLIYILLLLWLVRQLPMQRYKFNMYTQTSGLFLLSCLFNIVWIFLWHYEYFLSTVFVMVLLLITLIFLYKKIKKYADSFIDILPFSVYLGWVSVATITNISYVLVYMNWGGFGLSAVAWTLIMLVIATILAVLFLIKEQDSVFVLVFIWSFIGIATKNQELYPIVSYSAFAFAALLITSIIVKKQMKMREQT